MQEEKYNPPPTFIVNILGEGKALGTTYDPFRGIITLEAPPLWKKPLERKTYASK